MILTRRRIVTRALPVLVCALVLLAVPVLLAFKPDNALTGPQTVAITATPVPLDRDAPDRKQFGKLVWLGTVELTATAPQFGGYSGLAIDTSGTRLFAVSDAGTWLAAEIVTSGGKIEKLTAAKIGPLLGPGGRVSKNKHDADAEAIAIAHFGANGGEAYIAFEQKHRIGIYPLSAEGIGTVKSHLPLPARAKRARGNVGLEAVTPLRAGPARGAVLTFTEEYLDERGNHLGWLIGGPAPGAVTLKRRKGFAVTDAASLPGGDVVVLERRFRFSEGVKMRIRRIAANTIRPGALLDGTVLFETDDILEIDNMEGIAAHRDGAGRTIITVISDDNFNSRFQRTLLMQFALAEG